MMKVRTFFIVLTVALGCQEPSESKAQTFTNIAGVWNNLMFSVPAQLTLDRDQEGRVVNIREATAFEASTFAITVQADGSFTGPVNGRVNFGGDGMACVTVGGQQVACFALNAAGDFGYTVKTSDNYANDLELLLRAPANLAASEMAGTWKVVSFETSQELYVEKNTNEWITRVDGSFKVQSGTMNLAADGTFTINMGGPASGTATPGANGAVTVLVNVPGEGSMQFPAYVNAGKNIMASLRTDNTENRQELILFFKQPAATTLSSLKGMWRPGSLWTPRTLTVNKDWNGAVTGIQQYRGFGVENMTIFTGHTGIFTIPGETGLGEFRVAAPGQLTLIVPGDNGLETNTAWLNVSGDVLVSLDNSEESCGITLATRPPGAWPAASLGVIYTRQTNTLEISWASDTNRALQASDDLKSWSTVANTTGQTSYRPDPATTKHRFYRLTELR